MVRGPDNKKEHPSALPVFTTDTVEEAESLQILFCSLAYRGELKGRYIVQSVNQSGGQIEALFALQKQMVKAYKKLKGKK